MTEDEIDTNGVFALGWLSCFGRFLETEIGDERNKGAWIPNGMVDPYNEALGAVKLMVFGADGNQS